MVHRATGAVLPRRWTVGAVAAAVVTVAGAVVGFATPASAAPLVASARLTLTPTSGTAATSITATFQLRLADGDDNHCDLMTLLRWDGHLVDAEFTEGCTSRHSFTPLSGARAAGKHQVTAEDAVTHATASAVFTIIVVNGKQASAAGRTMVHNQPGSATGKQVGGEGTANRPVPSVDPPTPDPTGGPRTYPAGAPATNGSLVRRWVIGSSVAIIVVGLLVIILAFPQTQRRGRNTGRRLGGHTGPDPLTAGPRSSPQRGGYGTTGSARTGMGKHARSLMTSWWPNRQSRHRAKSASPWTSA